MNPKLSIICVTYNHENYIGQALEGFLQQRVNFPIEIIVGDDASSDGTPQIIKEYADRYPSLLVPVLRQQNIGAIPNFADLFSRVRGEYAALCDGDDYWTDHDKLQKQVDFLDRNSEYAMCFHPVRQVYDDGSASPSIIEPFVFFGKEIKQRGYFTIKELIAINFIPSLSAVYRFQLKNQIPDWLAKHKIGDYPMHLLHAATGDIGYIDEVMGVYRKHPQGLWWNHDSREHHVVYMQDFRDLLADVNAALEFKYEESFKPVMLEAEKIIAKVKHGDHDAGTRGVWNRIQKWLFRRNRT